MKKLLYTLPTALTLLLVPAGAALAQTPVTFAPQVSFATSASTSSVVAADVNGDGKPDMLAANFASATVGVLLNTTATGAGVASFAAQVTFATGRGPLSVAAADVNGDGKLDMLVANYIDNNTVSVLLNTTATGAATPSFAAQVTFATGVGSNSTNPNGMVAADVNGDGKPDMLVANFSSNNVGVLLNTTATGAATPSFAAQATFATGGNSNPTYLAVADLNGDGKPDVLVANQFTNNVGVLFNTTTTGASTASFAAQVTFTVGFRPASVAAADVNGDGKPDVLVANSGNGTVGVLLNGTATGASAPSFSSQTTFATGSNPRGVAAADVNGDGKPDLLVANNSGGTVSVLLNTTATGAATPSFAAQATFTTGTNPSSVAAADVNGDGKPDLVVANTSPTSDAGVLLNTTVLATRPATLPGTTATLSPNPARTAATLALTGLPAEARTVAAALHNALGQVVGRLLVPATGGTATAPVPTSGLAAGVYLLQAQALDAHGTALGALPTQRLTVE